MVKPAKKQPKIRTIKKKVWKIFSEYIRLRDCLRTTGLPDYGNCITCSKTVPRKLLQAGHYIPGRHNQNLFEETGCHAQCYNCNINLKGNTHVYAQKLRELYGEGHPDWLYQNAQIIKKYTLFELEELVADLKEKIKEMEYNDPLVKVFWEPS